MQQLAATLDAHYPDAQEIFIVLQRSEKHVPGSEHFCWFCEFFVRVSAKSPNLTRQRNVKLGWEAYRTEYGYGFNMFHTCGLTKNMVQDELHGKVE